MKRGISWTAIAMAASLVLSGCGGADTGNDEPEPEKTEAAEKVSLGITSPENAASIKGNTVILDLEAEGIEIAAPDKNVSGSAHYHVFIDKEPVPVGTVIPKEEGIIHSAEDPITIPGLPLGEHTLKVVLGDPQHKRIEEVQAEVKVSIAGPTLDLTVPADIAANEEGMLNITEGGVTLVKADQDTGAPGTSGHLHILIDPETPPKADGQPIPAAVENKIIHTTDKVYKVKGLEPGEHTIWVVLGDKAHVPFDPLVADKATITVK